MTGDSLKAQSSVETKPKASRQKTDLHEGACFRTTLESIINIANVNDVARDIDFFSQKIGQHYLKALKSYPYVLYLHMYKNFRHFLYFGLLDFNLC